VLQRKTSTTDLGFEEQKLLPRMSDDVASTVQEGKYHFLYPISS
jgi:hypothetical protein